MGHGYIDGRTLKQYFCVDCGKAININTALYGTGKCVSCYWKGSIGINNPLYIEGLIREYPLEFNNTLKEAIRQRDNYQCQICGKTQLENGRNLPVHYIDYVKANLNPYNLITLCMGCHVKTSVKKNRETYIEFFSILRGIING